MRGCKQEALYNYQKMDTIVGISVTSFMSLSDALDTVQQDVSVRLHKHALVL